MVTLHSSSVHRLESQLHLLDETSPIFVVETNEIRRLQTVISEFTQQDCRKKRTAKRLCDKRDRAIAWECCRGLPLSLMFSGLFFKTKLSRLSHKVCHLLSFPVLLRKFTIILKATSCES